MGWVECAVEREEQSVLTNGRDSAISFQTPDAGPRTETPDPAFLVLLPTGNDAKALSALRNIV
ncbi:hypothetical protein TRAPUB_13030 [Trametes pubescens]|uniref:Uncharacterized protein n=1 Tax=Trametes pubescens TaxID=154538 RepID=A0A1M2VS58_TRAPU|nr:hypothetical protein TRAPUB_13030 [Trametes pubescens]